MEWQEQDVIRLGLAVCIAFGVVLAIICPAWLKINALAPLAVFFPTVVRYYLQRSPKQ